MTHPLNGSKQWPLLSKRQKWFRWHDAGDVQNLDQHMAKIIEVCKLTPDTKHWLPTQERQYLPAPEDVPEI
jgi:hypothetical protein